MFVGLLYWLNLANYFVFYAESIYALFSLVIYIREENLRFCMVEKN